MAGTGGKLEVVGRGAITNGRKPMETKEEVKRINERFDNALPLYKKIALRIRRFFAGYGLVYIRYACAASKLAKHSTNAKVFHSSSLPKTNLADTRIAPVFPALLRLRLDRAANS